MQIEGVDVVLDTFRTKTKIKGETAFEKLNGLVQRWVKAIEDSEKSEDISAYRADFALSHRKPVEILINHLESLSNKYIDDFSVVQYVIDGCREKLSSQDISSGQQDALAFIIVELECCLPAIEERYV